MPFKNIIRIVLTVVLFQSVLGFVQTRASGNDGEGVERPASSVPKKDVLEPLQLSKKLGGKKKTAPLVIHTGPSQLYQIEHIPGAVAVGQTAEPEGEKALKAKLGTVPKNTEVVLYCGCCPWVHCPNIGPAYAIAKGMGFRNVKVLDIPSTFKVDWINLGYPTEKGTIR